MNILRVVIDGEEYPNYTITKAFERYFNKVETIWWETYMPDVWGLNYTIQNKLQTGEFDVVFMQLQKSGAIYPDTIQMFPNVQFYNWTGDVREDIKNYTDISPYVTTLFSNSTDVEKMKSLGYRSDFLQVGYDHSYYYLTDQHRLNTIAFIGSNYPNHSFDMCAYRKHVVEELYKDYRENTRVHGNGWNYLGLGIRSTINKQEESHIYNTSLLALNIPHFDYKDYYSDRLLRAMASGCCVLSKRYEGYEKEFTNKKNIVVWDTIEELKELIYYYITNRNEALEIGANASEYVKENCKWDNRVKEFLHIINKKTQYERDKL